MKFARALVVARVIAVGAPFAAACGSAPDPNLFSRSGSGSGDAGMSNAHAGTRAAGGNEDGKAGSSDGRGGDASVGNGGVGNGSSGAAAGGAGSSGENGEAGEGGVAAGGVPSAGASFGAGAPGAGAGGAGAGGASVGGAGSGGGTGGAAGVSGSGAASGASLGGAGAGGSGGADSCPALPPADKTNCNVSTPSSCFYAGVACSCLAVSPGPATTRQWACYGTPDKCPNTKPTAGSSCKDNLGAECPYPNQDYCICKGSTPQASWVCQSPSATCMATKPAQNLVCGPVRTCQYSDVACFCNASNWSCLGG